jgi:hypothetical protein
MQPSVTEVPDINMPPTTHRKPSESKLASLVDVFATSVPDISNMNSPMILLYMQMLWPHPMPANGVLHFRRNLIHLNALALTPLFLAQMFHAVVIL